MFQLSSRDIKRAANYGEARQRTVNALRRTSDQGRRWLAVNAIARGHKSLPYTQPHLRVAAILAAGDPAAPVTEYERATAARDARAFAADLGGTVEWMTFAALAASMPVESVMEIADQMIDHMLNRAVENEDDAYETTHAAVNAAAAASNEAVARASALRAVLKAANFTLYDAKVAVDDATAQHGRAMDAADRLRRRSRGRAPRAVARAYHVTDTTAAHLRAALDTLDGCEEAVDSAIEADPAVVKLRTEAQAAHDALTSAYDADSAAWAALSAAQRTAIAIIAAEWQRLAALAERLAARFPLRPPMRAPVVITPRIPYAGMWDGATTFHRSICCGNYWFGASVTGTFVPVIVTLAAADDDLRRDTREGWQAVGSGGCHIQTYTTDKTWDSDVPQGGVWVTYIPYEGEHWYVVSVEARPQPENFGCVDSSGRW